MSGPDLPVDIAAAIADKLTELADLARFRSVCPSWRSASAAHAARRRAPLLLLPGQHHGAAVNRRAWSPADDGSLTGIQLPAARGRSFLFASGHGWTLAVSGRDLSATLVHPFTGASSALPPLPFSSHGDVTIPRDLVWDWSPHGVLVSPRNGAFFCGPGDGSWRPVGPSSSAAPVSSVTYCDGAFYLFDGKTCRTTVVDAETLSVAAVIEPPALEIPWQDLEASLVVSPDELLLLLLLLVKSRGRERHRKFAKAFRADRVPSSPGGRRTTSWSRVGGIAGERAVFVDHLRAFCVEANGLNGVRGNCIYLASSREQAINDYYGSDDVCMMCTVSVLDCSDDPTPESRGHGKITAC